MNQQEAVEEAKKRGLKWVAMDEDGGWFGYSKKPTPGHRIWNTDSLYEILANNNDSWRDSLTEVK